MSHPCPNLVTSSVLSAGAKRLRIASGSISFRDGDSPPQDWTNLSYLESEWTNMSSLIRQFSGMVDDQCQPSSKLRRATDPHQLKFELVRRRSLKRDDIGFGRVWAKSLIYICRYNRTWIFFPTIPKLAYYSEIMCAINRGVG
jgi:hypothetical protein